MSRVISSLLFTFRVATVLLGDSSLLVIAIGWTNFPALIFENACCVVFKTLFSLQRFGQRRNAMNAAKPVFVTEQASLRDAPRLPSKPSMSYSEGFHWLTFEGQTQSPLGLGWGRRQIVC